MRLNYHEGDYYPHRGNTMFGGYWRGADDSVMPGVNGLFYLWCRNDSDSNNLFGSLSQ